jgi:hypothetical protein
MKGINAPKEPMINNIVNKEVLMMISSGVNRMISNDMVNMEVSNGVNRSNSSDMVSMVVNNGDNRMIRKDMVNHQVSNGVNRSNSSDMVSMVVNNGDNRMIRKDMVNHQVSNGDNRSNSSDMVSMVVSNGDSNNTSVSDKMPDSSGVSKIMDNIILISLADNMEMVDRDSTQVMVTNLVQKETMDRETVTIRGRNTDKDMERNIAPDNIQAMELNMVHSTKIPMDKEIANGTIPMNTDILPETSWIMIADLAGIMKEDVKKVIAVHMYQETEEIHIPKVVLRKVQVINMADHHRVHMTKDLISTMITEANQTGHREDLTETTVTV